MKVREFKQRLRRGDPSLFLSPWIHALLPVSFLYGRVAAWRRRRLAARAVSLGVPVLSVGNMTVGGTGKTPVVEMVVRDLLELGRRPAVLSRGYGKLAEAPARPGAGEVAGVNDEFLVLEQNIPGILHYQDPSRVRAGRKAIGEGADVLVLDDGFQHVALRRDLDLVLIDAINPFGFGRVFPAGLLREPLGALGEADAFVLTRCRHAGEKKVPLLRAFLRARFPHVPQVEVDFQPLCWVALPQEKEEPLESLKGRRALAFAGIGNPEGFRREVQGLGLRTVEWIPFPDHYRYTQTHVERIRSRARSAGADVVVLTQKDAVKISPDWLTPDLPWMVLRIRPRLAAGVEIYRELLGRAIERTPRSLR